MGTALVILVLLALCGFIAYIGDLLGRRLGKKRLSVFGLRPKHTAILLTIVTGVLIAAVTFGAALASVPMFRDVVTRGERLATTNRALEAENLDLGRQNQQRNADNSRLAQSNRKLVSHNRELATVNGTLSAKNAILQRNNGELVAQRTKLQAEYSGLQVKTAELRRKNDTLLAVNADLGGKNQRLQKETARLVMEVGALRSDARGLYQEVVSLKGHKYLFRRDQTLALRPPIPRDPPRHLLEDVVKDLRYEGEARARQAKAPRVELVPPPGFGASPAGVKPDAAIQQWVVRQALGIRGKAITIRLVVAENCVEGRPVLARFEVSANDQVFARDELIAQRTVDGASTPGLILRDLLSFLQTEVRGRALAPPYSMMPGEDDDLGEISWDRLWEVSSEIHGKGRPMLVEARARQDTYRSGPLNVDLKVRPVDVSQARYR